MVARLAADAELDFSVMNALRQQQPAQSQAPKIVLFGDSISSAVGYGTDSNPDTKFGQTPAEVISRQIGVPIESQSMGGVTTQDALTGSSIPYAGKQLAIPYGSYEQYLRDNKPNVVLLRFGAADAIRLNNPQQTLDNLNKMVQLAKQYGAQPILIGVSPFAPGGDSRAGNINVGSIDPYIKSADAINQGIQQIASQNQLPFVDVRNLDVPQGALLDGVHPTAAFGKEMAQQIGNALTKTFPQYGIQVKRDVVSMLPEGWSGFNEAQKLNWFNRNQVTPQELLNAGVSQQEIDTMSGRGYTGNTATAQAPAPAPAKQAFAGFDPSQGNQVIGGLMYQPIFDDYGNLQEVLRYQPGQIGAGQSYERLNPQTLQPTGTGQFQKTAGIGTMLRETAQDVAPLILAAVSMNPALAASIGTSVANLFGVQTLTAGQAAALGRTAASVASKAVTTGNINLEDAIRGAAISMFAPSIGKSISDTVADAFYNTTGVDLPDSVVRAVSNAAASAAATSIQQGADTGDIGRNALAGAISSAVTTILNDAKLDPSLSAAIGRTTGSYISTGDAVQSVFDGVARGIAFEEQQKAAATEKDIRQAYKDPSRGLDVLQPGAGDATTSSQAPTDVVSDVSQAPAAQQIDVTGSLAQTGVEQPFAATAGGVTAPTQRVEVTGPAPAPTNLGQTAVTDQDVIAAMQKPADQTINITGAKDQTVVPTTAQDVVSTTPPDQRIDITGTPQQSYTATGTPTTQEDVVSTLPPADQRVDITGTKDQSYTVTGSPVTEQDVISDVPPDQKIDITGTKDQQYTVTGAPVTEEDVVSTVPDQTIQITAPKDQTYTVTGTPVTEEDVISDVPPDQVIDVTGTKDQQYTVTGTPVTEEDVISDVPPSEPPAPSPPPPPSDKETTYPTELFKYINKGKGITSPLLTQALTPRAPGQVGLAYSRPAGEIESEITGKKRRDVWNEASLRLKDALGL